MSHIVLLQTEVRDAAAGRLGCRAWTANPQPGQRPAADAGGTTLGRHPVDQCPGVGRQFGHFGAGQLPPVPAIGRNRPGAGPADHQRKAEP